MRVAPVLVLLLACAPAAPPLAGPAPTVAVPSPPVPEAPRSRTAEPPLSPVEVPARLMVTSAQPDVTLSIDGQEPAGLPRMVDLPAGPHVLSFAGARYESREIPVTLAAAERRDIDDVRLEVLRGIAAISLATPGARVYLEDGADRRELVMLPMSVSFDAGKRWVLRATKPGYCPFVQLIDFSDGVPTKAIEISLRPGCRR